jgi:hypothetical protein
VNRGWDIVRVFRLDAHVSALAMAAGGAEFAWDGSAALVFPSQYPQLLAAKSARRLVVSPGAATRA